jgi:hypothetical protein
MEDRKSRMAVSVHPRSDPCRPGAIGYLLKNASMSALVGAIRAAAATVS